MGARVAVAGASGYAGGELLRLLAGHPDLEIVAATAHSQVGAPLVSVHPQLALDLALTATDPVSLADADLVFLALPHGESAALAAALPATVKVVDLGSDHRGTWVYGLPELPGRRAAIAAADRVANTGCYAVATILALAPLIAAGLASPDDVVVVAASGTSGAGRTPQPHLLATEIMGSLLPYRVGVHQHVPEIKRATGARTLSMTPVLAPMPRGILATVTAVASPDAAPAAVREALAYAGEPFVRLVGANLPEVKHVAHTNFCDIGWRVDPSGRAVIVSVIDNLLKGASGQAVQNMNAMLGVPETAGLL